MGAQKNRQHMFWLRNKKIIFRYAHLSGGLSKNRLGRIRDKIVCEKLIFLLIKECFVSPVNTVCCLNHSECNKIN